MTLLRQPQTPDPPWVDDDLPCPAESLGHCEQGRYIHECGLEEHQGQHECGCGRRWMDRET